MKIIIYENELQKKKIFANLHSFSQRVENTHNSCKYVHTTSTHMYIVYIQTLYKFIDGTNLCITSSLKIKCQQAFIDAQFSMSLNVFKQKKSS